MSRTPRAALLLVLALAAAPSRFAPALRAQQAAPPSTDAASAARAQSLVLQTAEVIEFTTDEVTWPSLDVSPDGRTVVFDLLGDLYTMPVAGGEATRIVGGLSFESQPTWSPDGKTVAFLSDRSGVENLWLADADGANPRAVSTDGLTKDRPQIMTSPAWTPDGQYLVVSRSRPPDPGTFGLFLYHRDGGTGVRIGPAPPAPRGPDENGPPQAPPTNRMGAVVSPDGRYVYFTQRTGSFTYNARFPLWQVYRHDRETGDVLQVTNAQGSAMRPALSPDGQWLVYGTRYKTDTGLRIRNLASGVERWVVLPVTHDDQESRASRDTLPRYDFTPDGQSLIVPIAGGFSRVDVATGTVTRLPFSARVQAEIAPRVYTPVRMEDGPSVRARLVRWPRVSPDGRQLVFAALNKLWLMDLPSGTPRRLTTTGDGLGEFMPAWSPDGRTIAFASWTTTGGHLHTVPAGGGAPATVTPFEGYYVDPVFTPDGTRIVYLAGASSDQLYAILRDVPPPDEADHDGDGVGEIGGIDPPETLELRSIAVGGGAATTIAAAQGGREPHFVRSQPDRVYLTSRRGLQSITLGGYDRRTHFRVTGSGPGPNPPGADEIRMSPDGTRAVVSVQNRHYLVPVPKAGREVVEIRLAQPAVPVKRLSADGGFFLDWTPDGRQVTWAWGARVLRQSIDAEAPETIDVIVDAPRARPSGSVLLSGARIITMRGDDVLDRGDVLVTGNRIAAIGRRGTLARPPGTVAIDVSGKTIMPGLVDAHAHMWPPRGVHQTEIWQYLANLAYGVTTTRDPQTSTPDVFAYADMVDAGLMPGPRILATGPGVFSTSGIEDRDAAFRFIRRYKEAYRTNTIKQYVAGDRLVRQWIIEACREYGITATIEGSLDLKLNLTQMADGYAGQEHSFPIAPLYKDITTFVARTKTFYTPTTLVAYGAPWTENFFFEQEAVANDPKLRKWIPTELLDTLVRRRAQWFLPEEYGHTRIAKSVADIVHAGGRASLGSHGQLQGLGAHWETWALGSGGLTPHETLRVVTLYGAEAIGMAQDVGSLEPGKMADLLVLDRNPLENLRHTNTIRFVMKNGVLHDGATLDEIWPTKRPLKAPFWWSADPAPAGKR